MSRNIDKANTLLFRFQEQQAEANGYLDYNSTQRPRDLSKVKSLKDAENWRKVILREIDDKIMRISRDSNLSEYQIRDLNEELNNLCKEKYRYEYHILHNLNGSNYLISRGAINKYIETNSIRIKGYRYFGRARELSDVKELIERQEEIKATNLKNAKTQANMLQRVKELKKRITPEYFGYLDDLENDEDLMSEIRSQTRDILGDELVESSDEEMKDSVSNESQKLDRRATRQRVKMLKKIETNSPVILIKSNEPVTNEHVQQFLLEKKRRELQEKYNI